MPTVTTERLTKFVSDVLDRNGDGQIDTLSESSKEQMANLLGSKDGNSQATPEEIANGLQKRIGNDSAMLAKEITDIYSHANPENREDASYMEFSGYSALHISERLGLRVQECMIKPAIFQDSVKAYLEGKSDFGKASYLTSKLTSTQVIDPYTNSNYRKIEITHVDIKARFDFEKKQIEAETEYTLGGKRESDRLILDTDGLEIARVLVSGKDLPFTFGEPRPFLGRPLIIDLPKDAQKLTIQYKTTIEDEKRVSALQWLDPIQTSGGKKPFFYTQGQYYYNRGWFPMQDTPAVKATYNITVEVKSDLGLQVVASNNKPHNGTPQTPAKTVDSYDQWKFSVDSPISPYLVAIAIGDLVSHKMSDRSIVYAEQKFIEAAKKDFQVYNAYYQKAEELFGPASPFETVDTLLLPPSFPYGGMENLGINFDHSMLITGDGSLMDVPLHEITHIWFGNMVTNANLESFWINEGFDVYAERAVYKAVHGEESYNTLAIINIAQIEAVHQDVEAGHTTCLATKVIAENPEDVVTFNPYEKGFLFVKWLEEKLGGEEKMLPFLRKYIDRYRFKNLTTADFQQFLETETNIGPDETDIWLYGPGMPFNAPQFSSPKKEAIETLARKWANGETTEFVIPDSKKWGCQEWLLFTNELLRAKSVPQPAFSALKTEYKLEDSTNNEILQNWFTLVAKFKFESSYTKLAEFLDGRIGRAKVLLPIYRELKLAGEEELARSIYKSNKQKYHPITRGVVERVLPPKIGEK